jgi:Tfx family DNA-binding protein
VSLGLLTRKQLEVLELREKGYSQLETARLLEVSRASVSMIESRARKKIERARDTIRAYEKIQEAQHVVTIPKETRLQQIPMLVLQEADRCRIHVRSNMVDILRLVKSERPRLLSKGKTTGGMQFAFNERGKLRLLS